MDRSSLGRPLTTCRIYPSIFQNHPHKQARITRSFRPSFGLQPTRIQRVGEWRKEAGSNETLVVRAVSHHHCSILCPIPATGHRSPLVPSSAGRKLPPPLGHPPSSIQPELSRSHGIRCVPVAAHRLFAVSKYMSSSVIRGIFQVLIPVSTCVTRESPKAKRADHTLLFMQAVRFGTAPLHSSKTGKGGALEGSKAKSKVAPRPTSCQTPWDGAA